MVAYITVASMQRLISTPLTVSKRSFVYGLYTCSLKFRFPFLNDEYTCLNRLLSPLYAGAERACYRTVAL